jgi:hypothetical protein
MTTTTNDAGPVVIDHVIGDRGRLVVRLAAAELRLVATDGDRIVVRTPQGRALPSRVVIEPTDDGLTIREKEASGLAFGLGRRVVQLEIALPAMAEISIDTAGGWLDALGLTGEQRYRTVSGEIRLRQGAGQIELNTVSGDATIELAAAADLAIRSVSGDALVRGGRLEALRIGTTSGDVRVESPLVGTSGNKIETLSGDVELVAAAGMTVEARTVSGDLLTDLPHRSEGRMGRRTLVVGDGAIELVFRSVSGDLRIHDGSGRESRSGSPIPPLAPLAPRVPSAPMPPFSPDRPEAPDSDGAMSGRADLAAPADRDDPADADADDDRPIARDAAEAAGASSVPPDPVETERMEILRALEHGELDVPAALDRLNALDGTSRPAVEGGDE